MLLNVLYVLGFMGCGDGGREAAHVLGFLGLPNSTTMETRTFQIVDAIDLFKAKDTRKTRILFAALGTHQSMIHVSTFINEVCRWTHH